MSNIPDNFVNDINVVYDCTFSVSSPHKVCNLLAEARMSKKHC